MLFNFINLSTHPPWTLPCKLGHWDLYDPLYRGEKTLKYLVALKNFREASLAILSLIVLVTIIV
ncbi:MAG: hypothetical protein EB120_08750, partial [Proteobacteria bacterium]|nr:hypothetical protein [Pseudomonadota bacterium]